MMNELVTRQQEQVLPISSETKELIQSSMADSTLKRLWEREFNPSRRSIRSLLARTQ